jgi:hypothetical protein
MIAATAALLVSLVSTFIGPPIRQRQQNRPDARSLVLR